MIIEIFEKHATITSEKKRATITTKRSGKKVFFEWELNANCTSSFLTKVKKEFKKEIKVFKELFKHDDRIENCVFKKIKEGKKYISVTVKPIYRVFYSVKDNKSLSGFKEFGLVFNFFETALKKMQVKKGQGYLFTYVKKEYELC